MKKLFVHWKLIVVSLTIFLIAGLSSYFYFGHQQQELDKTTQSVQSTAIQAMEKKEKQRKKRTVVRQQDQIQQTQDRAMRSKLVILKNNLIMLVKMLSH
ncbi:hypothetical protein ACFDDH_05520 [Enterococcus lactis]|uniref:hypothetical protein n=1 Tax=Enterococcus lactis TaxID=357441 RepID=UPI0039A61C6E